MNEQPLTTKRTNHTVLIVAGLLALGIATGIAAQNLDDQTLAALAGAICGLGVAIPLSFAIAAISRHRQPPNTTLHVPPPSQPHTQPTIFVVGGQPLQWPTHSLQPPHLTAPVQRTFTTIGEDEPQ